MFIFLIVALGQRIVEGCKIETADPGAFCRPASRSNAGRCAAEQRAEKSLRNLLRETRPSGALHKSLRALF